MVGLEILDRADEILVAAILGCRCQKGSYTLA
jgi:hypothetical protein